MAEDWELCTAVRHHQHKIALFLAAMRSYRDELRARGRTVRYHELEGPEAPGLLSRLDALVEELGADRLVTWEVSDAAFETRLRDFAEARGLALQLRPSPMFVTPRADLDGWMQRHPMRMAAFYRWQRERMGVLLEPDGKPVGGRWSFDADNRQPLPDDVGLPGVRPAAPTRHVADVIPLVARHFPDHPGAVTVDEWWMPTTRVQAQSWLAAFLDERFAAFGPYEDAMSDRDPFLFHSALTPMLNTGLLTPMDVLEAALERDVPLASKEGFVRQLIGWREFIRGAYRHRGEVQRSGNFFGHQRRLTEVWWTGDSGIPPLDEMIARTQRWGYAHHIERLMVAANLMTLCEVEPDDAYRWFMEMFVDSADWVMVPNVYGMGLFADGGLFATKPYICGSNYLRKMSHHRRGPWCDAVDGLYWRFIARHRDFFASQPRLAPVVRTFDRMSDERKSKILPAAEAMLERLTRARPTRIGEAQVGDPHRSIARYSTVHSK